MADGSATALLGIEGFCVLSHTEEASEIWMLVETTADLVGCPSCGVRAVGHGRRVLRVREVPIAGRAVRLVWRKRRWRCSDPHCGTTTFGEDPPSVTGVLTRRAGAEICRLVDQEGRSVTSVARHFGVGWHTAMAAVQRHGQPLIDDPRRLHGVRALGVDEHKMLTAGPTHHTVYCTQLVDIDRDLLLDARTRYFRDHVEVATIDPHAGYFRALSTSLPRATVTVDVFHAVKVRHEAPCLRRRVRDPPRRAVAAVR